METLSGSKRYDIERRLGSGGFGIVYRAFDRERGERIALKVLKQKDPGALFRFKKEFRSLADIRHPNLVTFHELISDGEEWFFTMTLVEGVDFLDFVRGIGPTDPRFSLSSSSHGSEPTARFDSGDTTRWGDEEWSEGPTVDAPTLERARPADGQRLRSTLLQLAHAIETLHRSGKLHRDIKPSNVLVDGDGQVKLLDFGLVKDLGPGAQGEGVIVGTAAYMAPEQARGDAVDEAADWYSVGAMLYEALTGTRPHTGGMLQVLVDKQNQDPPAPGELADPVEAELAALCMELLARDPSDRPVGGEILRRLQAEDGLPSPELVSIPDRIDDSFLLGRGAEMSALWRSFDARGASPTVVHVHGFSGIGKTALCERFLDDVAGSAEAVVLRGRCYERESLPYKAMDGVMDSLCEFLHGVERAKADVLMPRDISALVRLFPVLERVDAVREAPSPELRVPDQQELRRKAYAAARELLARLADRRPLVIFIDDLQWGDLDSTALLTEILRPPDAPAAVFVLSYRSEERKRLPVLRSLTFGEEVDQHEIAVEPLTVDQAEQLAMALLGENTAGALARSIARESRGNPFFIGELSRYVASAPQAVIDSAVHLEQMVLNRLAMFSGVARDVVELVAVAGHPIRIRTITSAAELPETSPYDELRAARLIRGSSDAADERLECWHDRVRETVVASLAPDTLRSHHRRLAAAYEQDEGSDPERLATHHEGAGDLDQARRYAIAAAEQASRQLAFVRAAELYRRAMTLGTPGAQQARLLHERLGEALASAGRGGEAAEAFMTAAEGTPEPDELELLRRAAEQLLITGHITEGNHVLRSVLARIGMKVATRPWRALLSMLWSRLRLRLRGFRFRERREDEVPPDLLARADILFSATKGLATTEPILSFDYQSRYLMMALRTGEPYRIARGLAFEAAMVGSQGTRYRERALNILERARKLASGVDNPLALPQVELAAGTIAYCHGRWRECRDRCDEATRIFRERCTGAWWEAANAQDYSIWARFYLGEYAEIRWLVPQLLDEARQRGDLFAATNLAASYAYVTSLADDRIDDARRELRAASEQWDTEGFQLQDQWLLNAQTLVDLYAGDYRPAWVRIRELWPAYQRSMMKYLEVVDLEMWYERSAVAMGLLLADESAERGEMRREVRRGMRILKRHRNFPGAGAMGAILEAGLALDAGDDARAARLFEEAERDFEETAGLTFVGACRRCRGLILGGDEGQNLVVSADSAMAQQTVRNPERMAAMVAPGVLEARGGRRAD